MNIEGIYNPIILNLFTINFDEINKYTNDEEYNWENIKPILIPIFENLKKPENNNNFIKTYYFLTFLYLNYTNYLKFIKHNDFNNEEIYKFYNKIKFNSEVINNIFNNFNNKGIKKILNLTNPFYNHKITSKNIIEYIKSTKQIEKLSELSNTNSKKILNIIIFRFIHSKNLNYNNYNNFFLKKIICNNKLNYNNFESFITQIPNSQILLNIKIKDDNVAINFNIKKIIKFFLNKNKNLIIINNEKNDNKKIILSNKKYGGKIYLNFDNNFKNIEFNYYQNNYNLVHYNVCEKNEFNFLKKTFNFLEINLISENINNISDLLHIIHLLTISIKYLENYPTDLYECLYPLDYSNYYFSSFCNFFEIIKPIININTSVNKFILDLIKYLYIYSYYDYYFYYSNKLIEAIISNFNFKYSLFDDFLANLKNVLKLPNELLNFPPFFDIVDDINSIIYYNFEIPSYFKFFDLINALCFIFDQKFYNKNPYDNDLIYIILKYIKISNKKEILEELNSSVTSSEESLSTENISNSSILIENKVNENIQQENNLFNKNNSYIEIFDINDTTNYMLITDIN